MASFAAAPSVWWDGIYRPRDWWKITRVCFPPSIRRSNAALMLRYGAKPDLAPGSGMFLVKLWCAGPGRGHMKGSQCQSSEMFSGSLMKSRACGQTQEHAYHTLYKRKTYNAVDKHSILFLLFKGRQSVKAWQLCQRCDYKAALPGRRHKTAVTSKDTKIIHLFFFCLCYGKQFHFSLPPWGGQYLWFGVQRGRCWAVILLFK